MAAAKKNQERVTYAWMYRVQSRSRWSIASNKRRCAIALLT